MKLEIVLEQEEEGTYSVHCPALKGFWRTLFEMNEMTYITGSDIKPKDMLPKRRALLFIARVNINS